MRRFFDRLFARKHDEPVEAIEDSFPIPSQLRHQSKSILYYVGRNGDSELTEFIRMHLDAISSWLQQHRCEFVGFSLTQPLKHQIDSLIPSLMYKHPDWNGLEGEIAGILSKADETAFNRALGTKLRATITDLPAFVLMQPDSSRQLYHINLDQSLPEQIRSMIDDVCDRIKKNFELPYETFSCYDPKPYKGISVQTPYDADAGFSVDAQRISAEVLEQITNLMAAGENDVIIEIFETLLTESKISNPSLHSKLMVSSTIDKGIRLSRLVVDEKFKIWLPEYNNMEIVMTPLPKALYLLFLRHPEGIRFHDLVDHKQELLTIYGRITNSSCTREIRKRIDELTDMRKNSVNEKCSRIKEAFVSRMAEKVAQNYFISGHKGQKRAILLTKELRTLKCGV